MHKALIIFASMAFIFVLVRTTNSFLFEAPVPESAILLLLGFILVIIAGIWRKKNFSNKK